MCHSQICLDRIQLESPPARGTLKQKPIFAPPPQPAATYNSLVEAEAEEWLPPPPPHPGPPLPPPPARPARRVQFSSREQVLATPSPGRALAATTTPALLFSLVWKHTVQEHMRADVWVGVRACVFKYGVCSCARCVSLCVFAGKCNTRSFLVCLYLSSSKFRQLKIIFSPRRKVGCR